MKIHNTLTRSAEDFQPLHSDEVRIYSCGPTVYDHIHIGNLSAFITADTLRRTLVASGYSVRHVMNFTDVDDKTIKRSSERYPDLEPRQALTELTKTYETIFLADMEAIGNDTTAMKFVRATESIEAIRALITELYKDDFAYITEDGVYFSIEKYQMSGKQYGQLLELTTQNTSAARVNNDEYDKESVHDFALWKTKKEGEPSWSFELNGHSLSGRPGWHIECSAMSVGNLGQPFDIHTGGVDLIFPHHENEIAQSTALNGNVYAKYFVHNEHLLVDGKKMSKSLSNFFTLKDIQEKGYDPLAFRLMLLQSHYRSQTNFTWESLEAAQNRLQAYRDMADMVWQPMARDKKPNRYIVKTNLLTALQNDMNTPEALTLLSAVASDITENSIHKNEVDHLHDFLRFVDNVFGLELASRPDITDSQKKVLVDRENARSAKDWTESDALRIELKREGVGIRDTEQGQIWYRL